MHENTNAINNAKIIMIIVLIMQLSKTDVIKNDIKINHGHSSFTGSLKQCIWYELDKIITPEIIEIIKSKNPKDLFL